LDFFGCKGKKNLQKNICKKISKYQKILLSLRRLMIAEKVPDMPVAIKRI